MKIIYVLSFLLSILLFTCSPPVNQYITYVSFDNKSYPPQNSDSLKIYKSELPGKYIEIGALKFEDSPELDKIIKKAANIGAMGLIQEGDNYILFIFPNKQKGESDAKTI